MITNPATINTNAIIKENNRIFFKATNAEKRVLIAKDIISRIKSKQYMAWTGSWAIRIGHGETIPESASLQKCLIEEQTSCMCCGVGSLFLSTTVFKNRVQSGQLRQGFFDFSNIDRKMTKDITGTTHLFGREQLLMIEAAFELGQGYVNFEEDYIHGLSPRFNRYKPAILRAVKFGKRFRTEKTRLVGIMNNIIENDGTFIP